MFNRSNLFLFIKTSGLDRTGFLRHGQPGTFERRRIWTRPFTPYPSSGRIFLFLEFGLNYI
jgi:hypothetical protein